MVLAIECDGASYHSSATARDRDRLRQEHLERLGWTFHRVWSQDWFYHPEAETERALAAYRAAVAAAEPRESRRPGNGATLGEEPVLDPDPESTEPPSPVFRTWVIVSGVAGGRC
jgi:hypothetical protein